MTKQPSLYSQLTEELFEQFSKLSEPFTLGEAKVILYRGLKISKRKCYVMVEDTSQDIYSAIKNPVVLQSLIEYANRQKEAGRATENHRNMA